MALPNQIGAYPDCIDMFERALADQKGIRVRFDAYADANNFQMRMHQLRKLLRDESRRMYERDEPAYDKSEFDGLIVRTPRADTEGGWWVYIQPHGIVITDVESLSEQP